MNTEGDNIILEVKDLKAEFLLGDGSDQIGAPVLEGVSFKVERGKTLGIVGESGCGKSVTAMSIMNLLPRPLGKITKGEVVYHGNNKKLDLLSLRPDELYRVRGNRIAMIFQEPMTALNPVQTVEQQLGEVYELHRSTMDKKAQRTSIIELLTKVGISEPETRLRVYPHQLSGGMRQRVMIAMALACKPDILIADEPTTALDVTIQAQILELMADLQKETGMAIIFITHDLGVVAEVCDHVVVMYAGKVVEQAGTIELFDCPAHPYTRGLLDSIPKLNQKGKSHLSTVQGTVPSLTEFSEGCRFNNRCRHAEDICRRKEPEPESVPNRQNHMVACHRTAEILSMSEGSEI